MSDLKLLPAENNAFTIVINALDATSTTATELNTIDATTAVAVNATAITGLASDDIDDTLIVLTAGNNEAKFTATSFSNLTTVVVADTTLDVANLVNSIAQANTATGKSTAAEVLYLISLLLVLSTAEMKRTFRLYLLTRPMV